MATMGFWAIFIIYTYSIPVWLKLKKQYSYWTSVPYGLFAGLSLGGIMGIEIDKGNILIPAILGVISLVFFGVVDDLKKNKSSTTSTSTPTVKNKQFTSTSPAPKPSLQDEINTLKSWGKNSSATIVKNTQAINKTNNEIKIERQTSNPIIFFTYENAQGDVSDREVRINFVDTAYIQGFCYSARDTRTFRLDRIIGKIEQDGEYYSVKKWLETQGIKKHSKKSTNSKSKPKSKNSAGLEIHFTGFTKKLKGELEALADNANFIVRRTVTKNLNFLVTGDNAGPSKIDKAINAGAILLNEDEFREMLDTGEIPYNE
ncbi:BRCT domain-containing protein [Caviibacterium pharyngocola]|uniref:BRCT domain-containing protein n=1 Tax=Caviibacterium pharyngocola TaxID=28159 RepID=A0A2M8RTC4_9PAST|nr:BRCT domain-containing protein [Caviibacterium pharyngocola]PJG82141.1 hypothetical protein CVP04_10825 [Caviibacterium pharyngocola]